MTKNSRFSIGRIGVLFDQKCLLEPTGILGEKKLFPKMWLGLHGSIPITKKKISMLLKRGFTNHHQSGHLKFFYLIFWHKMKEHYEKPINPKFQLNRTIYRRVISDNISNESIRSRSKYRFFHHESISSVSPQCF